MLQFEYPWFLLLLLLFIACSVGCKLRSFSIYFPHVALLRDVSKKKIGVKALFKWLTIIGAVTALASPVVVNKVYEENNVGYDIVVAIDASGSMKYPFSFSQGVSKFDVTKKIVGDFIVKRKKDNLGVVGFGKYGFIVSPLSYDKKLTYEMLQNVVMDERFSNGTAIGDAIAQGVRALKNGMAKSKMIVLVTDGNEEGEVAVTYDKATQIAKNEEVKIYTIGIGREGDYNGRLLRFIAQETGGKFFSAADPKALAKIYDFINKEEKSEIKTKGFEDKRYYFIYPLFVSIMALFLYILVRMRSQL